MANVDDSLRANHSDDFRCRRAVPETTDFFLGQCGRASRFFGYKSFWVTLDAEVQLLRQLISLKRNVAKVHDSLRTNHSDNFKDNCGDN